ncbi:hypothetical protein Ddye_032287 [Dipteronia dyeriana]|uniref:Uncharacterized protein n=1 Tax=Dipteronia dyeriana TaxID=168575 RepID=A0AAD9TL38_9ROSI|nr:hypothetical protein Ddye_032287 [Dipteronia dyeriana]
MRIRGIVCRQELCAGKACQEELPGSILLWNIRNRGGQFEELDQDQPVHQGCGLDRISLGTSPDSLLVLDTSFTQKLCFLL